MGNGSFALVWDDYAWSLMKCVASWWTPEDWLYLHYPAR